MYSIRKFKGVNQVKYFHKQASKRAGLMFGDRSVKSGAELLKAKRSPLFQEGVASSRLRRRPPPAPALTLSAPPASRAGRKTHKKKEATGTIRGIPRELLTGLVGVPGVKRAPKTPSQGSGSSPPEAGKEDLGTSVGREEHKLLADKVETLTAMMQQVADKVLRSEEPSSESDESQGKKVQFVTPTKLKRKKKGRRGKGVTSSSEDETSESESSSESSEDSFHTPIKDKRAQELERSWEDKLTHLAPEDRTKLLKLLGKTNRKVPSSSRLESSLSVFAGLGGESVSHRDVAELTYDMRRNDQRRIAKAELTKATKSLDAFYDFITKQRAWHPSSPDFGYLTTMFHQARALEKRYGWKAAEFYILDRFTYKADNPKVRWRKVIGKLGRDSNYFLSILSDCRSEIHSKFQLVPSQSKPSGGDKGGKAKMHPRFPDKPTKYPKGSAAAKTATNTEYCEDHNAWFKPGSHSPCWMAGKPDGPHRR